MGGCEYSPKTGGFQPKWEGWNLWHFSEDDIACACCPRPRQLTALWLTDDDNDDYQWLPAEFRNHFSFGKVCWHRPGSYSMWVTAPRSKLTLRNVFHPAVVSQPLFRQNFFMWKLMWQFVLNRVWQIIRCMFMSGSNNREAAVLKDVIITGKRSLVTRLVL